MRGRVDLVGRPTAGYIYPNTNPIMSITTPTSTPTNVPSLETARAALMTTLRRALVERRQAVDIGDIQVRFQRGGETFEDNSRVMLALATGLYLRLPAYRGGEKVEGHWMHHGPSDNMEAILLPHIAQMSVMDLEGLRVGISASHVLREMAAEKSAKRVLPSEASMGELSPTADSSASAPTPPSPARRPRMH